MPVPAGKVDQVPRTCMAGLRKETTAKEFYNKDGVERFRHVSTKGSGLTPTLPFPSPGDLPSPGIEPRSPALQADSFTG